MYDNYKQEMEAISSSYKEKDERLRAENTKLSDRLQSILKEHEVSMNQERETNSNLKEE